MGPVGIHSLEVEALYFKGVGPAIDPVPEPEVSFQLLDYIRPLCQNGIQLGGYLFLVFLVVFKTIDTLHSIRQPHVR